MKTFKILYSTGRLAFEEQLGQMYAQGYALHSWNMVNWSGEARIMALYQLDTCVGL